MPKPKSMKNKKAISTIVGALLMVATVTIACSAILASSTLVLEQTRNSYAERFVIEDVWFNSRISDYFVNISIYNCGNIQVKINTVYINNDNYAALNTLTLNPGARDWISVAYSWTAGNTYLIKIASERGTKYESYWKA